MIIPRAHHVPARTPVRTSCGADKGSGPHRALWGGAAWRAGSLPQSPARSSSMVCRDNPELRRAFSKQKQHTLTCRGCEHATTILGNPQYSVWLETQGERGQAEAKERKTPCCCAGFGCCHRQWVTTERSEEEEWHICLDLRPRKIS